MDLDIEVPIFISRMKLGKPKLVFKKTKNGRCDDNING